QPFAATAIPCNSGSLWLVSLGAPARDRPVNVSPRDWSSLASTTPRSQTSGTDVCRAGPCRNSPLPANRRAQPATGRRASAQPHRRASRRAAPGKIILGPWELHHILLPWPRLVLAGVANIIDRPPPRPGL